VSAPGPAELVVARTIAAGRRVHVVGAAVPEHPAFVVGASDESELREAVEIGDAVILAGEPDGAVARDRVLRRVPVWGAESVWIGVDGRPYDGLARAVVIDADADAAIAALAATAALLADDPVALAPAIAEREAEVCITCSDEGRLGEVLAPPSGLFEPAIVRTEAGIEQVDTTLVGDVAVGELVLIHAGGAIARIPEPERTVLGRMAAGVAALRIRPTDVEEAR